jgi:hypothetical protein
VRQFAKLFESVELGQVLVVLDDGEDGPEISVSFMPEGLGVCSMKFKFNDDQHGEAWDKAELGFENFTEEAAVSAVREVLKIAPGGAQ